MQTPWGNADFQKTLAPGIIWVGTPSHGGCYVEPVQLEKIPLAWREASFGGYGKNGWFEEDCDWCMVALTFPELFPAEALKAAQSTFDGWIAKKIKQ